MRKKEAVEYKNQGNEAYKEGSYEKALELYGKAVEIDPDYRDAWNNIYLTLLKLERIDDARKCKEILARLGTKPEAPSKKIGERQYYRAKKILAVIIVVMLAFTLILAALSIFGWVGYRTVLPFVPEHMVQNAVNTSVSGITYIANISPAVEISGFAYDKVNVTALRSGKAVVIRNNGGPEIDRISTFTIWVDDNYQGARLGREPGSSVTLKDLNGTKNHLVVTGRFTDGAEQVILDTSV